MFMESYMVNSWLVDYGLRNFYSVSVNLKCT